MSKKAKKDPSQEPKKTQKVSRHFLSWAVFLVTISVTLLSVIPVVFPALIARSTSILQAAVLSPDVINPYQPGVLAGPLIAINIIILGLGILYYKRSFGKNILNRASSFELSKRHAIMSVIVILVIFSAITAGTLSKEETWVDYTEPHGVRDIVYAWNISQWTGSFEPHFKYLLLSESLHLFGNMRIVPFITSISLLLLTYFFTTNITQKRFAGVVSMAILLQSDVFVTYGTSASYENSWIVLYLFSLYLVQKFYRASTIPYFISLFSKPLIIAFMPATFYFIARSDIPRRSRIYTLGSYGIVIVMLAIVATTLHTNFTQTQITFDGQALWQGFSAVAMQMRFDYIIVLFLLPLTVMLFFASRKGVLHADSIMVLILVILLSAPFLLGFTQQTNQPYRFVSLSVFFAIGVGILLSKRTRMQAEVSSSIQ